MPVKRVSPEEAQGLMASEGYAYVDVRSIPEFEAGHPEGAYNVPWKHMDASGWSPTTTTSSGSWKPPSARTRSSSWAARAAGGRSAAAETLIEAGFTHVVDQRAGFVGGMGPQGLEPGWATKGLPTSQAAEPGRAYAALAPKAK